MTWVGVANVFAASLGISSGRALAGTAIPYADSLAKHGVLWAAAAIRPSTRNHGYLAGLELYFHAARVRTLRPIAQSEAR